MVNHGQAYNKKILGIAAITEKLLCIFTVGRINNLSRPTEIHSKLAKEYNQNAKNSIPRG